MHDPGDHTGPSGLVAGPEAGPVVAVKLLIKQEVITPVRVIWKLSSTTVNRAIPVLIFQEDTSEPAANLFSHLIPRNSLSRTGGALTGELTAKIQGVLT